MENLPLKALLRQVLPVGVIQPELGHGLQDLPQAVAGDGAPTSEQAHTLARRPALRRQGQKLRLACRERR
jgi:hypothetical protein